MERNPQMSYAYDQLKQGAWTQADSVFCAAIGENPKNAEALLGRLLVVLQCKEESDLGHLSRSFAEHPYYQAAYRAADAEMKERLHGYCESVNRNAAGIRYQRAVTAMQEARTAKDYGDAAYWFGAALKYQPEYPNAAELQKQCIDKVKELSAEECPKEPLQSEPAVSPQPPFEPQKYEELISHPQEKTVRKKEKKYRKNWLNYLYLLLSLPFAAMTIAAFFGFENDIVSVTIFSMFGVLAAMFLMLFASPPGTKYLFGQDKGLKKWHLFPICLRIAWLIFELYLVIGLAMDRM